MPKNNRSEKSLESWIWDAACSINDLIESVLYLPEILFYNTTPPGVVLFLNRAKPTETDKELRKILRQLGVEG